MKRMKKMKRMEKLKLYMHGFFSVRCSRIICKYYINEKHKKISIQQKKNINIIIYKWFQICSYLEFKLR